MNLWQRTNSAVVVQLSVVVHLSPYLVGTKMPQYPDLSWTRGECSFLVHYFSMLVIGGGGGRVLQFIH